MMTGVLEAIRICQRRNLVVSLFVFPMACAGTLAQAADPLSSWHEGSARKAIMDFIEKVTAPGSSDFVPVSQRIVVFDNDGMLWAEQPMYFQLFFALNRIKALAPQHSEWETTAERGTG